MDAPMQTRGRKAFSDVTINVAADMLAKTTSRSDLTTEETAMILGTVKVLRALATQVGRREASYGKKNT
ncbi:hypothetical protein Cali_185 [Mycobacterium phage Cali]|uniref:Uncharacterized protein n=45 Tax=Bixzunavirus TaxID=680114 RepID=Q853C1_BPMBZ|nr:gp182 [Mycobacterium phage Bxz1]YP_002224184.1 hypothetical protein SCOTTMCG_185 [Mycobacterium phage ScottMcG]YP_002224408.1 gp187 [Mycobacterium phage Spud]YP_002224629.1 gp185 [Mycobacterium phage Cali]YP_002224850.1 gp185 [Mycobacterium phage Rizal]YP_003347829.1 hypothetical protein ET08_179 [Mycobacterium phage ET08]YP_008060962.1 hypothetical protein M181_gp165 [Mycobacterium phage Gizmo]YP_008061419.1 hypothetical protein M180_gp161 [Mycobacterium phage ArcherS7]YP_008061651.1 hy